MKRQILLFLILVISTTFTQDNDECSCVPFYLCQNGTINTNGEGIIDIRIKVDQPCAEYLDICCPNKDLIPVTRSPVVNPAPSDCGMRNPDGIGFKITGDSDNEAQFGEFPWMIAVFNSSQFSSKYYYRCGGSLIHPQVVLTAAHCVDAVGQRYKIRAGEWDSQTTKEFFKHQDVDVATVVRHSQFDRRILANDVALLFLSTPLKTAGHINRVCLPPQNRVASGRGCFVTGWGKAKFDPGEQYQTILKRIEVPVVPRGQCQNAFRSTRLGVRFKLDPTFMCAGGQENRDSCTGDGGGPLVCPIAGQVDRFQQVGIVAWGIGCGGSGIPGAYVDVARYRDWIDQQLVNKDLDTTVYKYF